MRRLFVLLLAPVILLAACATTPPIMRSDVTAFHEWPATLADKTFSFKRTPEQAVSLESKSYERLIADQMARYGLNFKETGGALTVSYEPGIKEREVKVREPVDPWPYYGGPYWRGRYYDPFWGYGWGGWPMERSYTVLVYTRTLKLNITDKAGKRLFEATAVSEGTTKELPVIMPGLVTSVFEGFPGESGKARRVQLPLETTTATPTK
jgi:Domain of unknown function (DUF4136)